MKKKLNIILLLLVISLGLTSCSKTKSKQILHKRASTIEHVQFMGIPVDGTIDNFIYKLKQKRNYTITKQKDTITFLRGKFMERKCDLMIKFTPQKHIVYLVGVSVSIPNRNKWDNLLNEFNNISAQYSCKYGNPTESDRQMPYGYSEGDGNEMYAIGQKGFMYEDIYNYKNKGTIVVMLKPFFIFIIYMDNYNSQKYFKEKNASIQKDI